ncbi:MAG TPA: response regulator [Azospirillaceae bacterium]|nr:response regulator [Azospirillaceae bacterium]
MTGKPEVLVVDDDPLDRFLIAERLADLGYAVHDTYSGPQALGMLYGHPAIGLLVTDMVMPGMSGTHLANRAREIRPDLKVVLVSGRIEGGDGLDETFLPKPLRPEALARTLDGMLRAG